MPPFPPHTAFILGAGLGTRLRPLTDHCPKPMLPIAGRPMITYAMDHLIQHGVTRFIINTHHAPEAYSKGFPHHSWKNHPITFVHEPILLDTAGGLKNIEPHLTPTDENIWLYNGDILTSLPLQPLLDAHLCDPTRHITLALRTQEHPRNVRFDPTTSRILDLRHRLGVSHGLTTLYAGIALVRRSFFSFLIPGRIESLVEVFLRMIQAKIPVHGHLINEGHWTDLGTLQDYQHTLSHPPNLNPKQPTAASTDASAAVQLSTDKTATDNEKPVQPPPFSSTPPPHQN
ncbi:MAG: nucleotidyltransferase family protein [Verrucomicrobiae bacterium]|nr:nucleotidyltransferase family protein [Verrucomicrobiae bacterium]